MNDENKALHDQYVDYLKQRGHYRTGLTSFRTYSKKLIDYLESEEIKAREINVKTAQDFQGYLLETPTVKGTRYKPKSVSGFINAAVSFCEFLKKRGLILSNPFKEIRKIRVDKKVLRNLLNEKEISRLLDALENFDEAGDMRKRVLNYKTHVVCELLYASGMRIGEAARLTTEDIDFNRGMVMIREGKGGVSRYAYLNEYACGVLKLYVDRMRVLMFSEQNRRRCGTLFGVCETQLSRTTNRRLNEVTERLGLAGITCHGFRHAVGYHLLRSGCNIRHIQQILGHKLLRSTEVYTKVDKENLKKVLDTYHPRKWRKDRDENIDHGNE